MKKRVFMELFLTFLKIGLFTFGGGYAMIAVIEDACVEKKSWLTHDDLMNAVVIAESTPGPIAINCATYVGQRQGGLGGAAAATVGVVLPSFAIIYLISLFLERFLEIAVIANAFRGIQIAVGLLILKAAVSMIKSMSPRPLPRILMLCALIVMLLASALAWNVSSIGMLLAAGAISLIVFALSGAGRGREEGVK